MSRCRSNQVSALPDRIFGISRAYRSTRPCRSLPTVSAGRRFTSSRGDSRMGPETADWLEEPAGSGVIDLSHWACSSRLDFQEHRAASGGRVVVVSTSAGA